MRSIVVECLGCMALYASDDGGVVVGDGFLGWAVVGGLSIVGFVGVGLIYLCEEMCAESDLESL